MRRIKIEDEQFLNAIESTRKVELETKIISELLDHAANTYTQSKATTNAGRILRFIASIIPASTIIKLFAHKLYK